MASYLVALDFTLSSPLLFERFSVSLLIVYLETTIGSHRSLLARHIGPLIVFFLFFVFFVCFLVLVLCCFVFVVLFCFGFFFGGGGGGLSDMGSCIVWSIFLIFFQNSSTLLMS